MQLAKLESEAGVLGILQRLGDSDPESSGSSLSLGQWVAPGSPLAITPDPTNLPDELEVKEVKVLGLLFG